MIQVTCYNILITVYSDQVTEIIRYIEIFVGVGLGIGPSIGSCVYGSFGYSGTMYMFGVLNFLTLGFCSYVFPWVDKL